MKKRRRILAWLVSAAMVVTMIPTFAFAVVSSDLEEVGHPSGVSISGVQLGKTEVLPDELKAKGATGTATYDQTTGVLVLSDFNVPAAYEDGGTKYNTGIKIYGNGEITVEMQQANIISVGEGVALETTNDCDVIFSRSSNEDSNLTLRGKEGAIKTYGSGNVTVEKGKLTAQIDKAANDSGEIVYDAINCNDLTVNGGQMAVLNYYAGRSYKHMINFNGDINVNGGKLEVLSDIIRTDNTRTDLESDSVVYSEQGNVTVSGGTFDIYGKAVAQGTDGDITGVAEVGDGLHLENGDVTLLGGELNVKMETSLNANTDRDTKMTVGNGVVCKNFVVDKAVYEDPEQDSTGHADVSLYDSSDPENKGDVCLGSGIVADKYAQTAGYTDVSASDSNDDYSVRELSELQTGIRVNDAEFCGGEAYFNGDGCGIYSANDILMDEPVDGEYATDIVADSNYGYAAVIAENDVNIKAGTMYAGYYEPSMMGVFAKGTVAVTGDHAYLDAYCSSVGPRSDNGKGSIVAKDIDLNSTFVVYPKKGIVKVDPYRIPKPDNSGSFSDDYVTVFNESGTKVSNNGALSGKGWLTPEASELDGRPAGLTKAELSWTEAEQPDWLGYELNTKYTIYRADKADGEYEEIVTVRNTESYIDEDLAPNQTYYYKIVPANCYAKGEESDVVRITTDKIATVDHKAAFAGHNKLKVSWSKADKAVGYMILRAESSSGEYSKVADIASGNTVFWTDKSVKLGKTYYYKMCVIAADAADDPVKFRGKMSKAASAKVIPCTPANLKLTKNVKNPKNKKLTAKWTACSQVSGWQIAKAKGSGDFTYKSISKKDGAKYTYTKLGKGTYKIKVRAYKTINGKKLYSGWTTVASKSL